MKNVFIIGSKGIPARYGGFETFVDQLTMRKKSKEIKYYVSCMADSNKETMHGNVCCINIKVPSIGSAKAIIYDLISLRRSLDKIKSKDIDSAIIYILACRIGPFMKFFKRRIKNLGVSIYINPDGHEWKRSKWNWVIKKYWKYSERLMVKHSDLMICDSKAIEEYIQKEYKIYNKQTKFISYGAEIIQDIKLNISKFITWKNKWQVEEKEYYLIIGRFVPENNYELMIKEFMASNTNKKLIIVTNQTVNSFYTELLDNTEFDKDQRIKFVGTVYDQELLSQIRQQAFAYLHGHEVGGTNPSLLEALAMTKINLLLDVPFNNEVGQEGALYFSKQQNSLRNLIEEVDKYTQEKSDELEERAKRQIKERYQWEDIVEQYESLFINKK